MWSASSGKRRRLIRQKRLDQDNMCEICRQFFKNDKDCHLDHCHETRKYRGLLCTTCNVGLGMFKDHPGLLLEAVDYLKKYLKSD